MNPMNKTKSGFTIVELLIVVVVIGILAAITVVAYNGIQGKARDAQRLQDMASIVKALQLYRVKNGEFPDEVQTTNGLGWELSMEDGGPATDFLSQLRTSSTVGKVPIDPKNAGSGGMDPSNGSSRWMYFYHRYPAGSSGCDFSRGEFYVLGVTRMDSIASGGVHPRSPGFACSGQDWGANRGAWVTGAYTD